MLTKITSLLKQRKEKKRLTKILTIPKNEKTNFIIAHNKELCDVTAFRELLKNFNHYKIEGHYLQQNINTEIICFKLNIYETYTCLGDIYSIIVQKKQNLIGTNFRSTRSRQSSYIFFNEKNDEKILTFNQEALDQMVQWMDNILVWFDLNKTSQEEFEERFCSKLYQNIDIFYDFYYCLLCHILNIECDKYKSISIFKHEDI